MSQTRILYADDKQICQVVNWPPLVSEGTMELRTHDRVHSLKLNLGETLIVEFCPLGANESRTGGPLIGFAVSTMCMPGGKMALAIKMPDGCTCEGAEDKGGPLVRYLIDNPSGADEMTFVLSEEFPRRELAVKRVKRKERDETCCEGHCDRNAR